MPIYENSYYAIETGDWLVDDDCGGLLLASPDESAALRIDAAGEWAPNWQKLGEIATQRAHGAAVVEVSCGPFSGYTFDAGSSRLWLLTFAEFYLIVTYTVDDQYRDRDRELIDYLLSTLADRRA